MWKRFSSQLYCIWNWWMTYELMVTQRILSSSPRIGEYKERKATTQYWGRYRVRYQLSVQALLGCFKLMAACLSVNELMVTPAKSVHFTSSLVNIKNKKWLPITGTGADITVITSVKLIVNLNTITEVDINYRYRPFWAVLWIIALVSIRIRIQLFISMRIRIQET